MFRPYSWVLGYCLCILGISASLVLFGALSRPYFQDGYSNTSSDDELPISMRLPSKGPKDPPVLAYWISGSHGDSKRILRLLKAMYHPRNQYLLQLDAGSTDYERRELAVSVQSVRVFRAFGNVNVVGKGHAVNQMGASAIAATLRAAALLLKISADWDWFITLTASDYPLVAQDDLFGQEEKGNLLKNCSLRSSWCVCWYIRIWKLIIMLEMCSVLHADLLHAFSFLPRDLNFISYTINTGLKERQTTNRIIVDPSLYLKKNSHIFYAVETRDTPDAFKVFGGSPWVTLSRTFMEYCISGWDNLPRKLLMYFSNAISPLESYFHTVICNSPEFQNTTVDNDLRYIVRDTTTAAGNRLELGNSSEAVIARPFKEGDPGLGELDKNVLNRPQEGVVPGKWCLDSWANTSSIESSMTWKNNCSSWGDINSIEPGSYGLKLGTFFSKLVEERRKRSTNHCHSSA